MGHVIRTFLAEVVLALGTSLVLLEVESHRAKVWVLSVAIVLAILLLIGSILYDRRKAASRPPDWKAIPYGRHEASFEDEHGKTTEWSLRGRDATAKPKTVEGKATVPTPWVREEGSDAAALEQRRAIREQLGAFHADADRIARDIQYELDELRARNRDPFETDLHGHRVQPSDEYVVWLRDVKRYLSETPELGGSYVATFASTDGFPPPPEKFRLVPKLEREIACIRIQQKRLERFMDDFKG